MVPTTPGMSSLSMDVLSITMYQLPRFWSKEVAPSNMLDMLVTEDTSQPPRGRLKESALLNIPDMPATPFGLFVTRKRSPRFNPAN